MNNKKIVTYDDLVEERKRLENQLVLAKHNVKASWDDVKLEFVPIQNTFTHIGKFFTRDKSNPLLNMGLNVAGDVVLRRFLLAKADWVTRLVLPIFIKNYGSHVFTGEKSKSIFHKIKSFFTRKGKEDDEVNFSETGESFKTATPTPTPEYRTTGESKQY